MTTQTREEIAQAALTRATQNNSIANYDAIFEGFMEMGIDEEDILPRENVFTFNAWKALGRSVMKGQRGVKVVTTISGSKKDKDGNEVSFRFPKTTTVFHISQTQVLN